MKIWSVVCLFAIAAAQLKDHQHHHPGNTECHKNADCTNQCRGNKASVCINQKCECQVVERHQHCDPMVCYHNHTCWVGQIIDCDPEGQCRCGWIWRKRAPVTVCTTESDCACTTGTAVCSQHGHCHCKECMADADCPACDGDRVPSCDMHRHHCHEYDPDRNKEISVKRVCQITCMH